jgi:hypothetical protein
MDSTPAPLTTRREFAKSAALAALVPLVAGAEACAHAVQPAPAPQPAATPASPPSPGAVPPTQPAAPARAPDPQAVALTEVLKARFPDRLTAEQWESVRRGVEGSLATAKALHDFPLDITVEPPFAFRPFRAGGR